MLDELDRALLAALLKDPRMSFRSLAREAGTTAPTAIARVRRMQDLGAIQGFQVLVAPWTGVSSQEPSLDAHPPTCHQCKGPLPKHPLEAKLGARYHVFCCGHCQATFSDRFDRISKT